MNHFPRRRRLLPRLTFPLLFALLAGCAPAEDAPPPPETGGSAILDRITRPGEGGEVHLIRLVQHGDAYAFDPAELSIAQGDVVRFVLAGTQPESVAFDVQPLTPEGAEFVRRAGLDRGVLLTEPGDAYDVAFPGAPPGAYPFRSIPHGELGMRGSVRVEAP